MAEAGDGRDLLRQKYESSLLKRLFNADPIRARSKTRFHEGRVLLIREPPACACLFLCYVDSVQLYFLL